jgi:transposase
MVFFDTTSIYFEGEGGEAIGRRGNSKDHRPDLKQMVVGIVLDNEGNPVCSEIWPGNTTDVNTLIPIVKRLKKRFGINRICIVADRGMISTKTIEEIEDKNIGWEYILGVRMRNQNEVKQEVLSRGGRYQREVPVRGEVHTKKRDKKAPSPLRVKEVMVNEKRYIVCYNEDQARKDKEDREAIIQSLRDALKRGDKSLVGNKGFKKFIKTTEAHFEIDRVKEKEEERYDGKWVLRTNTKLSNEEVALKYKQLWMVESIFRSMKSLLRTRPIYHKCDETIRGHVFCSFLALLLRKELQDRLEKRGWANIEWADIIQDLDELQEIETVFSNKTFILRSETKGVVGKVIQATGATLPQTVRKKE